MFQKQYLFFIFIIFNILPMPSASRKTKKNYARLDKNAKRKIALKEHEREQTCTKKQKQRDKGKDGDKQE